MITKEIRMLDPKATKLVIYYKGRSHLQDEIIGIEVLVKDGSVLEWVGETETSSAMKSDATIEVLRVP
jgi:hypothetical protein